MTTHIPSRDSADRAMVGASPAFLAMLEQVSQVAALDKPVLVIGERGTGKELVAGRLHYLSPRWDQPLVMLNCATLTETLLETELFGHEAGAFTGATRRHTGRFERADGGTLFLDELATVPARMQEKILRVIEYGEFERVGGSETIRTDVRLVAATNRDLPALAERGEFRADLLDRLAFDVITLPPLRARPGDIPELARHFALNMVGELGRAYFPGFTPEAEAALARHTWPGNVRELKNVVERSVYRQQDPDAPVDRIWLDPFDSPWRPRESPAEVALTPAAAPAASLPEMPLDLDRHLAEIEARLIGAALERAHHNQREAARMVGLTYHQFRARLRKYREG